MFCLCVHLYLIEKYAASLSRLQHIPVNALITFTAKLDTEKVFFLCIDESCYS